MEKNQEKLLEQLFREMYRQLVAYAYSVLQEEPLAEEAVQETFRIACYKISELARSPNPKGWLTNTLKYVLKNIKRTQARLSTLLMSVLTAAEYDENAAKEDELDVEVLYSDLADSEEFQLLKKLALEKYSMREAAEELGISVEVCKKRAQRARRTLRKKIEKNQK